MLVLSQKDRNDELLPFFFSLKRMSVLAFCATPAHEKSQ